MKREFVKLVNLLDVTYKGESAETMARWKANVLNSVGTEGYTLEDSVCSYIVKEFSTDEIEFASADCYCFAGSAYEEERFYSMDWTVVKEKATGDLYVLYTDRMDEF